jgi:hypothetical protein
LIDALEFFVVLFTLLLVEGFVRLDPPSLLWRRSRGRPTAAKPNLYPGSGSWGWRYEWPFRPGLRFHTHLPPIVMDATGVASGAPEFRKLKTAGNGNDASFRYEDLRKIEAADNELHWNGAVIECQSSRHAIYHARTIQKLQGLDEEQRAHWIRSELSRICSAKEASLRLSRVENATRPLWFLGLCLWLFLVVGFPSLALWLGINWAILAGGAIAFSLSATIAASHRSAYRKVFGDTESASWGDTIRFALYPLSATKAAEECTREAFVDMHPIAFADMDIAKQELKRAWYWTSDDAAQSSRRQWFYDALRAEIETAIRRMGVEPETLLRPKQAAAGSRSYCPKCETEYCIAAGTCEDCAGVALVPLGR